MLYPVCFFEPQVRLARLLAERFGLALADALLVYTTAARSLGVADVGQLCHGGPQHAQARTATP